MSIVSSGCGTSRAMVNRSFLQLCFPLMCGVLFGLYVYAYSTQDNYYQSYKPPPIHQSDSQLHYENTLSNVSWIPLHSGNPSMSTTRENTDNKRIQPQGFKFNKLNITYSKEVTSYPQFILILAYKRSGSTFTGDVIQQHSDTMYIFEPLYSIWKTTTATFANGDKRVYTSVTDRIGASLRQLEAWFTCKIFDVDLETLRHNFMSTGFKTRAVKECMNKYAKDHFNETAKKQCVDPMIRRCESSHVRVVKTIRLNAFAIEPLLKSLPTLKVIHLVRDPRGILVSRQRVEAGISIGYPLVSMSKTLCDRIMADHYTVQNFTKLYPHRVMLLRYEELATHPLKTVKIIYKFVGLETNERILDVVSNMTSSKRNVEQSYNTARKDSVFTANAWRLKLPMRVTVRIDNTCGTVYDKYGYVRVNSNKQLKNIKGESLWIDKINT